MAAAMNEFRVRLRAALWWLVPLLAGIAFLAWETDLGRAIRKLPPAEAPVPARPVVTSLLPEFAIAGGVAARADTVQRTLFNPTRRPAPVLVVDASKPRLQRGQFALTGTMVVGGKNTAFLRENVGGKARRVLQGDTVNGILVADVQADRVRLTLGDEWEDLILRVATNPRPTLQPAATRPTSGPTPAAAAAMPVPADGTPTAAGSSVDQSLAERRRAARAAQAVAQTQTPPPAGSPAATPAPASSPATAGVAPAPGNAPDPRWGEVYRAYQQRGPLTPPK